MFLGNYAHTLDDKGRLTIPAKYRNQLAAGLVITRSLNDRCLLVMPLERWDALAAKINALPIADPNSAFLRRVLFSAAEDLVPDKQGRILINQSLRDYAQIQTDVVLAGTHSFVELWSPDLWREKVMTPLDSGAIDTQLFADLNI